MANQVRARLGGDDYQHLFSWHHILGLLLHEGTIRSIRLEDEDAMSLDDLTVLHSDGRCVYYQVKWHVDQRSEYSESALTQTAKSGRSLLLKWYRSYRRIIDINPALSPVIVLVSNWGWAREDVLRDFISGLDDRIEDGFFSSQPASAAGKMRSRLAEHLQVDDEELTRFLRTLRFRVLSGGLVQFASQVSERMEHLGLCFDEKALLSAVGAVRTWIINGPIELTAEVVRSRIGDLQMMMPPNRQRAISVYLLTIKTQRFDVEPDYSLDWREHFTGPEFCKGHETALPDLWNRKMMPDLVDLESRINATKTRLLRVRGKARLSAWLAFGYIFSQVNGYTLEIEQNGEPWSSSGRPNKEFSLVSPNSDGELLSEKGETVAVGLSVSGSLETDVRQDVATWRPGVRSLLLLRPNRDLGLDCIRDQSDAIAFARAAKTALRDFAAKHHAGEILLYYFGPLGGACFLGHQLNAVCRRIQVMEHTGLPERPYAPSFALGAP